MTSQWRCHSLDGFRDHLHSWNRDAATIEEDELCSLLQCVQMSAKKI
jgi:hypothetical protein